MTLDHILPVRRHHLLLMQVLCWLAPGIKIFITGTKALCGVAAAHPERVWWLAAVALAVALAFSLMFHNFVKRYTLRILNFPQERKSLLAFLDPRGYLLIAFMMGLGIGLKYLPGMPAEFFAGFYPGLGIALAVAGLRFLFSWFKACKNTNH